MLRVLLNSEMLLKIMAEVSRCVSLVARVPEVRNRLVELQRSMACRGGVVMEGRDIGAVVCPMPRLNSHCIPGERARRRRKNC